MFKKAIPVFARDKENELNYQLLLRETVNDLKNTELYITAFSFYRLTVNGQFVENLFILVMIIVFYLNMLPHGLEKLLQLMVLR